VPQESKDDKYWARRMKNNEAAKRSRDMRIKREKVVFEENSRLEQDNRDLRTELVPIL
jgi:leukemia factor-related protein